MKKRLCHFYPAHRSGTGGELVGFKAEALQDRNEKIGERVVPLPIVADMLAVFETASGQNRRQVAREMLIRFAHIRAIQEYGPIEQGFVAFFSRPQILEEL